MRHAFDEAQHFCEGDRRQDGGSADSLAVVAVAVGALAISRALPDDDKNPVRGLPFPMVVDYSAAKAALTNLTKALSEEFAPRGVRLNAVAPGPVRTPFWTDPGGFADVVAAGAGTTAHAALEKVVPRNMGISTGRITEPEEVAELIAFLASPRAANITGAEFVIDGVQIKTI